MAVRFEYTIDQLAQQAGTTVRSIKVYHERGILPPPQVRGRRGFYGPEHLTRVRTISRLLSHGIKLNGIRELLNAVDRGDQLSDILGLTDHELTADTRISAAELATRYADAPNGLARAVSLGLYEPVDAVTYRVVDPQLIGLANQLVAVGIPLPEVLDELAGIQADCNRMVHRRIALLHRMALSPFDDETPAEDQAEPGPDAAVVPPDLGTTSIIELATRFITHRFQSETSTHLDERQP
ncbi:MerR family transcriptional regulator [Nocardia colli]|uniref:MerR family transcriptional regulator n=1 Tax=Nocardia colli TaxID=2545717 RepID=A0A5N0E0Q7_9NOCA|nr:MerR family transcriptional regulator [Nocardia colli]KAA8881889.1 MerR family transcriptional regulator [Nocardia colli]